MATSAEGGERSGEYFVKSKPAKANPLSLDPQLAAKLWQMSERFTGLAPAAIPARSCAPRISFFHRADFAGWAAFAGASGFGREAGFAARPRFTRGPGFDRGSDSFREMVLLP